MFTVFQQVLILFVFIAVGYILCKLKVVKYEHSQILTNWTIRVEDNIVTTEQPVAWNEISGVEHYSGTGVYECTFDMDCDLSGAKLCLSGLSCGACVYLNGEHLGDIWTHPLEISCGNMIRRGENHLKIEVYSTLINEMMADGSYEPCPDVLGEWPYYGQIINIQRKANSCSC